MSFIEQLTQNTRKSGSLLCLGLDPDIERLPPHALREPHPLFAFNRAIIDATHDLVCAYKPQIAYYNAIGAENQLQMTMEYLKSEYPHIPVILDAKRNDIGATAKQYAIEAFERYCADAITVNPYLGQDSLQPFLDYSDKGVIILCHTSNPGAKEIQELLVDGRPLYEKIAQLAATRWNNAGNVGLVVGATYPQSIARVRDIVGDMPLLIPGVGTQGGDVAAVVQHGKTANGEGLIINVGRAILYASQQEDFAAVARLKTMEFNTLINQYR